MLSDPTDFQRQLHGAPSTNDVMLAGPSSGSRNSSSDDVIRDRDLDPQLNTGRSRLEDSQIRLRYSTFPVLIFHIQALRVSREPSATELPSPASKPSKSHKEWKTLGFLSLEFRSDCGLWWHLYHEYPPGLYQASGEGESHDTVSRVQQKFYVVTNFTSLFFFILSKGLL